MANPGLATAMSMPGAPAFIPAAQLPLYEPVTWPVLATEVARQAAATQVRVDIAARMRSMWR